MTTQRLKRTEEKDPIKLFLDFEGLAAKDFERREDGSGAIRGLSVVTKGGLTDRPLEFDDTTLEAVLALGQKPRQGIQSFFGHGFELGTHLGWMRNFRRDGDRIRADLEMSKMASVSPQGDIGAYVSGMAREEPQAIGASMVVRGYLEWRLNKDGTLQRDKDRNVLPALLRVTSLESVDIVGRPAANPSGLFAAIPPEEATPAGEAPAESETQMSGNQNNPAPPAAPAAAAPGPDLEAIRREATEAERKRVAAIMGAALPGQEALASAAVAEGLSLEAAQARFLADARTRQSGTLAQLAKDPAAGLPGTQPAATAPPAKAPAPAPAGIGEVLVGGRFDQAAADAAWARRTPAEDREFYGDREAFMSYWRNAAAVNPNGEPRFFRTQDGYLKLQAAAPGN